LLRKEEFQTVPFWNIQTISNTVTLIVNHHLSLQTTWHLLTMTHMSLVDYVLLTNYCILLQQLTDLKTLLFALVHLLLSNFLWICVCVYDLLFNPVTRLPNSNKWLTDWLNYERFRHTALTIFKTIRANIPLKIRQLRNHSSIAFSYINVSISINILGWQLKVTEDHQSSVGANTLQYYSSRGGADTYETNGLMYHDCSGMRRTIWFTRTGCSYGCNTYTSYVIQTAFHYNITQSFYLINFSTQETETNHYKATGWVTKKDKRHWPVKRSILTIRSGFPAEDNFGEQL